MPDAKDWTWVLTQRCPDCGFDTREPGRDDLAQLSIVVGSRWEGVLADIDDPGSRPAPAIWSPLEYACHVRDVFRLASYRTALMLERDDPAFDNWDQDQTAIEDDYASQDPQQVGSDLRAAAEQYAGAIRSVVAQDWERSGRRGDGSVFTIESFTRYLIHDPIHHLTDVTGRRWQ